MEENGKTIYHYCGQSAFFEIMRNKKIWLSSAENLNDSKEVNWIVNKVKSIIDEYKKKDNCKELDEFYKKYKDEIFQPYIASFTREDDVLSQWRGYADDGKGVSIGFNEEYFDSIGIPNHPPQPSLSIDENIGICNITYLEEDQNKQLKSIIEIFISQISEAQDHLRISDGIIHSLIELTYSSKTSGFAEENETRLVYAPMYPDVTRTLSDEYLSEQKFRLANGVLTSYFELCFEKHSGIYPINSITFGPNNNFTKKSLISFLRSLKGYSNILKNTDLIRQSKLSYRKF